MSDPLDIDVQLSLGPGDEVDLETFSSALSDVNSVLFSSEIDDLRAIQREFPDLPDIAFDAAQHRMLQFRRRAALIRAVRPGSIEIALAATGIAVFVLQQTLGETLKESWRNTDFHKRLKGFLLKERSLKVDRLAASLLRKFERSRRFEVLGFGYQGPGGDDLRDGVVIRISLIVRVKPPPKRGESVDRVI
jgi:hypothetical protein